VYRTDTWLFHSASASLEIDGSEVARLAPGDFHISHVSPGTHTLVIDNHNRDTVPGRCEVAIELQAGTAYFYEVAPRSAFFAAGIPGGVIPYLGIVLSPIGQVIESAGKKCGGPFSLVPIERHLAMPNLIESRESQQPPHSQVSPSSAPLQ
jgi:hypothetical protein